MPKDDADECPASRAYPFFTMSRNPPLKAAELGLFDVGRHVAHSRPGGARRDRTDDLLLAKQALSQLSYGPIQVLGSGIRRQKAGGRRSSQPTGDPDT
jgi:hypothetical protein